MSKLVRVQVTFTREMPDGTTVAINGDLSAEDGWNQWGAPHGILGENVDALQAVQDALTEHWGA